MLRVACVRFWLSRLIAAESFAGQDVLIHDPAEFEHRLAQRQQSHGPAAVRTLKPHSVKMWERTCSRMGPVS